MLGWLSRLGRRPRSAELARECFTPRELEWLRQALALAILKYTADGYDAHAGRIAFLQRLLKIVSEAR